MLLRVIVNNVPVSLSAILVWMLSILVILLMKYTGHEALDGVGGEHVAPSQKVQYAIASVSCSLSLAQSLQACPRPAEKAAPSVSSAAPLYPGIPIWRTLGTAALIGAAKG